MDPKAAGIDVGNAEPWVAVPAGLGPEPVRSFGCFTRDPQELANWLGMTQMKVQLANAISDITETTGQAMLTGILAGERNPEKLARFRDPRIKASEAVIASSLEGNWRPELLFTLKQEFESYQMVQNKIGERDEQLRQHYQTMASKADPKTLPKVTRDKGGYGISPPDSICAMELYRTVRTDLTAINGSNVLTAQTILAEVGCAT